MPNENEDVFDLQKEIEHFQKVVKEAFKPVKHTDVDAMNNALINFMEGILKEKWKNVKLEQDKRNPTKINLSMLFPDFLRFFLNHFWTREQV